MYITWIDNTNMEFFVGGLLPETQAKADILIGAVTEEDERACGVLAAERDEGQINILSVYVDENDRHRGAGRQMLAELFTFGAHFGFNAVRISYADTPDMAEINDFFEACGMRRMESKQDFLWRIPVNGLSVFAAKAPGSMDKRLIAAETLGGRYLRAFEELVQQNHEILLPKDTYDDTLSLAFFDDESRCAAGMLVKKGVSSAEARLLLSEDASLAMVKAMLLRLIEANRETPFSLLIPVTNREVKDMISFFADAKAISAYRLNTWYMAL